MSSLNWASTGEEISRHEFAYQRSIDHDWPQPVHHPVVVVGAGPVGLSLAIDLAQRLQASGGRVLLLDNDWRLSSGSRAICFAKRTLEIWDRLGVGDAACAKGVQWNTGKVFLGPQQLYAFDLQPEAGHERPAFINLPQYYAEAYLALRAAQLPNLEIRWKNKVVGLHQNAEQATLQVETPDGVYAITAAHVAACDGSRSPLRALLGQEATGQVFRDRFLIADVRLQGEVSFPPERWFWFDPPFHPGQSVLLHRQPDDVWRIDFQLGWDADPELEKQEARIRPRVDAMMQAALGRTVPFTLQWASVYTFACQRMAQFKLGRVLFAGDAAHGVSPFGARGANSGVQDAENLAWKLAAVLQGRAPLALLDSYASERECAADENILHSTRATDFITPKSAVSRLFRDAVLNLARAHPFARSLVNSGRLSVPTVLAQSPLNTPERDSFPSGLAPGAPAVDAPLHADGQPPRWLLRQLKGEGFAALAFGNEVQTQAALHAVHKGAQAAGLAHIHAVALPCEGVAAQRYGAFAGTVVLLRPDLHVCARWRAPTASDVAMAISKATGQATVQPKPLARRA